MFNIHESLRAEEARLEAELSKVKKMLAIAGGSSSASQARPTYSRQLFAKMLKEAKQSTVDKVCAQYGISSPTYYNWKTKFDSGGATKKKKK